VLHIWYTVKQRVKESYWSKFLEKLGKTNPGQYMTETEEDDIQTVTMLLGNTI
jgi:hypothetical protein